MLSYRSFGSKVLHIHCICAVLTFSLFFDIKKVTTSVVSILSHKSKTLLSYTGVCSYTDCLHLTAGLYWERANIKKHERIFRM